MNNISHPLFTMDLTRGKYYWVCWTHNFVLNPNRAILCQFIQPTRKGFNFLNLKTHKCILPRHLYAKGFGGKPLPKQFQTFRFRIYYHIAIQRAVMDTEGTG